MVIKRLLIGLLSVSAMLTTPAGNAQLRPQTIKLEPYMGSALAMHLDVNGHEGLFLFDTGEGVSIITPEFAKAVRCTPWGKITGFRMTGQRMDFPHCDGLHLTTGATHLNASTLGVVDLAKLLPPDAPHVDGAAGLDIFAGKTITFDESGQVLTIETPASLKARVRNAKQIPIRLVRDAGGLALEVEIGVPTERGMAWMEMDSGNGGPIVIDQQLAPLFHLDPNVKKLQPVKLTLPGGIPVEGRARAANLIMDGNIGAQVLKNWIVTVNFSSGRAWLSRRAPR